MAEPPDGGREENEPFEQPPLPEETQRWDIGGEPAEEEFAEEEFAEEEFGEEDLEEERRHRTEETPALGEPGEPHTEESEAQTLPFGARGDFEEEEEPPEWTLPGEEEPGAEEQGEQAEAEPPGDLFGEGAGYQTIGDTDFLALEEEIHSPAEIRERRAAERAARRRVGRQRLAVLVFGIAVLVVIIVLATGGGGGSPTKTTTGAGGSSPLTRAGTGPALVQRGSQASVLPGNVLIADRNNDRVLAITPLGQRVWSNHMSGPSDAYPTRTLYSVIVTEHGNFQVLQVGVARHDIIYHYGHSGVPGSGVNRLHDPNTAQALASGEIVIADKSNCRILFVKPPVHRPSTTLGRPHHCVHNPPAHFSYPDAVFPTAAGGIVVSEFVPGWVDILDSHDNLIKALQIPGLVHPTDANQVSGSSSDYIATNFAHPGSVKEFDSSGRVIWSYGPTAGAGELNDPTLAQVLPNGDVLVSDSRNDRVIVIDRASKRIVWQYGHTGRPGSRGGYLHTPDSAVVVP